MKRRQNAVQKALGIGFSGLTDEARKTFKNKDSVKGVIVTSVDPGSPAAERGLRLAGNAGIGWRRSGGADRQRKGVGDRRIYRSILRCGDRVTRRRKGAGWISGVRLET